MDNDIADDIVEEGIDDPGGEADVVDDGSEDKARFSGWTPKEEFKGDPERWVDAGEWNDRADHIMPILKTNNKKLESAAVESKLRIEALERAAAESKKMTEGMLRVQAKVSEDAYNRAVADIRAKQKVAAQNEEWEKYDSLGEAQDELERPEVITVPADDAPVDNSKEAFDSFRNGNTWYAKEGCEKMTGYAHFLAEKYQVEGITDPAQQLNKVSEEVKKEFPDYFSNPRRNASSVDGDGGTPPPKKGSDGFDKLPGEAKKQYEALKKTMPKYTKKEFLEAYNE